MTSVASSGASPLAGYDYDSLLADSTGDDESWAFIDPSGSSNPGSISFFPSPASGSLASYGVIGNPGQVLPSPPAPSPLYLDVDQAAALSISFPDPTSSSLDVSAAAEGGLGTAEGSHSDVGGHFITPEQFVFDDEQLQGLTPFIHSYSSNIPHTGLETFTQQHPTQIEIPQQLRSAVDVPPWDPTNLKQGENMIVMEEFNVSPSPSGFTPPASTPPSASSRSPSIKQETGSSKAPSPIHKVRGSGARVEKKKSPSVEATSNSASASSANKFVIVTPNSISAHSGKHNPFECFEAMRTTQKGRKGPLANETKENALQVRRLGACFCCHARKVKCDAERPCKNCKKMVGQVPQVVCWQFQDFLTVLFPGFIRAHFKKEEMTKFMTDNIQSFTVDGAEKPCSVELSSGARFAATLNLRAKFFTAKTPEVLQHYHMNMERNTMTLESRGAVPIGLDFEGGSPRDELRRRTKEYINQITQEPGYADQVTDSLNHTEVPRKVLAIVQRYYQRTESAMVKKALSIYAMHYVMTRHLCLTRQSIAKLQQTSLVPQNVPWVTPRVLNRQIKSVIDEMLLREMQQLFESFSKSLKPKSRREWAPCTAAFLVLCLFMEAVELAADTFAISQNEINIRHHYPPQYDRSMALNVNKEVENLPFRQFAYQFHQIYQTHVKDATTKAFNPLLDDSIIEAGDLDVAGVEFALGLRELLSGDSWNELDFLTIDPILGNMERHPYPRDVSFNYSGRLTAKFLLSFENEKYIFDQDA